MKTNVTNGAVAGNAETPTANQGLSKNPEREWLGKLADGTSVFDKKFGTPSHLRDHPEVKAFLGEAFAKVSLSDFQGVDFAGVIDLGRIIGMCDCVRTTEADQIVFAQRPNRDGPSRFVKNREPEPCSSVKLVLWHNKAEGIVVVSTAFIGNDSAPDPWSTGAGKSKEAHAKACEFWKNHALVAGADFDKCAPVTNEEEFWKMRPNPPK